MKTNKKVMLSIALLMVNSAAFASEDFKEKAKRATSNALSKVVSSIPTVDSAKQAVANFASSSVDVVKAHPAVIGAIVTGAAVVAHIASTHQKGRDSAASTVYDRMPANTFKRAIVVPAEDSTNVVVSNGKSIQDMINDKSIDSCIIDDTSSSRPMGKKILELSSCNLTSLEGLENLPNKEIFSAIDLQFNLLTKIDGKEFDGFENVKQILLRKNKLSKIEECAFAKNVNLEMIDLSDNLLEKIHGSAFFNFQDRQLPNLYIILLYNNPLNEITKNLLLSTIQGCDY